MLETWNPYKEGELEASLKTLSSIFGFSMDETDMVEEEIAEEETVSLVELLKPLFPDGELTKTLANKMDLFQTGTFLFKVKLHTSCWRTIKLDSSHTLLDLHNYIQKAFDFDDDHLYAFYMDGKKFGKHAYHSPMDDIGPYVDAVKISSLGLYEGKSFLYLFDFGDEWTFDIQLLTIKEGEEIKHPIIQARQGEAPDQYSWY
jgi:hypothetical protein